MNTPLDGTSEGRVAIVTGGSRGVGRVTVRSLAARGYAVVVNYLHDQRAAESTVDMVLADNGTAVAVRADVADELDVVRLFAETIETFGRVDVVVHTVGSQVTPAPVAEARLHEFDAACRSSTRATFIVNREAARQVRSAGSIVNLCSSANRSSLATYGVHAAIAAATEALTRVLALELRGRDITVNAVALDVDRPCAPGRVAEVILYLVSAQGHGLSGEALRVDDGRSGP